MHRGTKLISTHTLVANPLDRSQASIQHAYRIDHYRARPESEDHCQLKLLYYRRKHQGHVNGEKPLTSAWSRYWSSDVNKPDREISMMSRKISRLLATRFTE